MANSKKIEHLHGESTKEKIFENIITVKNYTSNAIVISFIAFILYSSSISHGFVLDDGLVTTINSFVKQGFGGLWNIFTHSYRAGASITTDSDYMYRPLSVMMFAKEWAIAPNQAWFHHLFNVIYYALTIFILFKTLMKLMGQDQIHIVTAICLIFAVHPIHTEVVSNIKSRDEIMSFLFGMVSMYFYLCSYDQKSKSVLFSCIAFFLALLSKEGAVTFLFIIPLCIYFFTNKKPLQYFLPLFASFIIWFLLRYAIMGNLHYQPHINDNQLVGLNIVQRWANAFVVLLKYIQLLILPYPLSWDYSYNQFPIVNWSKMKAIVSLIIHLSLFFYAIYNWRKKEVFAFCIMAYVISMVLYSNLFFLIGTIMGERLAYQASLWFCFGLIFFIAKLLKLKNEKSSFLEGTKNKIFYSFVGLLSIVFFIMSFQRIKDWKSSYTLFLKDVNHVPNSFRANQGLADECLQLYMKKYQNPEDSAKYLTQAQKYYEESSKIKKTFSNQVGLGNTSLFQKNYDKAIDCFNSAQQVNSNEVIKERLVTAYYQYGRAEAQINNNLPKAKELLSKAYQMDSTRVEIVTDLGMVIGLSNQIPEAIYYFEKAYLMNPKDENIISNLAHSYIVVGQQAKADALLALIKK